jgi:hypothetical protein
LISSIILRLHSIYHAVENNWDESTFITVAQRLFNHAELPYSTTFEVKPPLAYLLFSPLSILHIHNLWGYRLFATILLGMCGYFLSIPLAKIATIGQRALWGFAFVTLYSLLPDGLSWMTELNAVFFTVLLFIVGGAEERKWKYVWMGILVGAMTFTRSNMIFALIGVFLYISCIPGKVMFWRRSLEVSCGFTAVGAIMTLPYIISGNTKSLLMGIYELPRGIFSGENIFGMQIGKSLILLLGFSFLPLLVSLKYFCGTDESLIFRRLGISILILEFFIALGILFTRPMFGHHLLQLTPMPFISISYAMSSFYRKTERTAPNKGGNFEKVLIVLTILIAGSFSVSILKTQDREFGETKSANRVIEKLKNTNKIETLWAPFSTFMYYQSDLKPSSAISVHPVDLVSPNILKVYFNKVTSFSDALLKVMDSKPDLVVLKKERGYFSADQYREIMEQVELRYILVAGSSGVFDFYSRRDLASS